MSRATVGMVIDELLTDESLRIRFAVNPMETVVGLVLRGFDLTRTRSISCVAPMLVCGS